MPCRSPPATCAAPSLSHITGRIIGDDAWCPADFKDAHVARTPSSAKPSPAEETHVARTPSSAKEPSSSDAAPTPPVPQPKAPSPATQPAPASNVSSSSPSFRHPTARVAESSARYPPRSEGRLARCKNTIRVRRNLPAERQRVPHRPMTDILFRRKIHESLLHCGRAAL